MSWAKGNVEIAAEEQDVGLTLGLRIGLDDHHDVEGLGEALVARLQLIDARDDAVRVGRLAQCVRGECLREFVPVEAVGTAPGIQQVYGRYKALSARSLEIRWR